MGRLSPYFSDKELIASLRKYFTNPYGIDFSYWLNHTRKVKDGLLVTVEDKRFLIDYYSGSVISRVE